VRKHLDPPTEPLLTSVNGGATMLNIGRSLMYELMDRGEVASVSLNNRRLPVIASIHSLIARGGCKGLPSVRKARAP
jgi:hypothetical protein